MKKEQKTIKQPVCRCAALKGKGICNACADMLRQQVARQREINCEMASLDRNWTVEAGALATNSLPEALREIEKAKE